MEDRSKGHWGHLLFDTLPFVTTGHSLEQIVGLRRGPVGEPIVQSGRHLSQGHHLTASSREAGASEAERRDKDSPTAKQFRGMAAPHSIYLPHSLLYFVACPMCF